MSIVHLNDDNFEKEVLKSEQATMVDFWADWCMPCKMLAPVLDEIAKEYDGKIKIAKLNVDEGQATATKYGVMSIPTIIFFKDGNISSQVSGVQAKEQLIEKIQENI